MDIAGRADEIAEMVLGLSTAGIHGRPESLRNLVVGVLEGAQVAMDVASGIYSEEERNSE